MSDWTIQSLLNWVTEYFTKKGVDSPRLCAEMVLGEVLKLKRIELYMHFDKPVEKEKLDILHALVKRAGEQEPVAYLIGRTEFYSLEMKVSRDCLIPRPETELLVERAIENLRKREGKQLVCDLCTGSGCIAVAIAKNFQEAQVYATDISDASLKVANENISKYNLGDRIKLFCGDLFEPLILEGDCVKFDLIACNPPYVSSTEYEKLDRNVKEHEPKLALWGGENGLDVYVRIIDKVDGYLKDGGICMFEIGYSQGTSIREMLEKSEIFDQIKIERDFHNNDRVVTAKKKN